MRTLNAEAARLQADYLARVRTALAGRSQSEAAEILQSVHEHIDEALSEEGVGEISLVALARVLENLGPPDSYRDPGQKDAGREPPAAPATAPVAAPVAAPATAPVAAPAATVRPRPERRDELVSALWMGYLVHIVGLFVPVINFDICGVIGSAMIAYALLNWPDPLPSGMRWAGTAMLWLIVIAVVEVPLKIWQFADPTVVLLRYPLTIAAVVLPMMVYWKIMGGVSSMLEDVRRPDLAQEVRRTRQHYLIAIVAIIAMLFAIGCVLALETHGEAQANSQSRIASAMRSSALGFCLLPLRWLLGWHFILVPIQKAREALTRVRASG